MHFCGSTKKTDFMIVAEESYETTEPTVDNHIVKLRSSGADVNITTPKFAAQAIRKISEIGWKPLHLLNNVSASIGSVMKPAGFEHGQVLFLQPVSMMRSILSGRTTRQ